MQSLLLLKVTKADHKTGESKLRARKRTWIEQPLDSSLARR